MIWGIAAESGTILEMGLVEPSRCRIGFLSSMASSRYAT